KDDRRTPAPDSPTRVALPAKDLAPRKIEDEDSSSAETEVFNGIVTKDGPRFDINEDESTSERGPSGTVVRREGSAPDARTMREARVQGQLEHPAIVPVYDLGVRPDKTPFFTMKRLHGETLSDIMGALQKGSLTAGAAYSRRKLLTAFSSVCLAVAFANARGVL